MFSIEIMANQVAGLAGIRCYPDNLILDLENLRAESIADIDGSGSAHYLNRSFQGIVPGVRVMKRS